MTPFLEQLLRRFSYIHMRNPRFKLSPTGFSVIFHAHRPHTSHPFTPAVIPHPKMELEERHQVIVIGAGTAGLACAANLLAAGIDVVVLEARGRIGGRIHSLEWEGLTIDVGASWIHGVEGNPLMDLAENLGVTTVASNLWNSDVHHGSKRMGWFGKIIGYLKFVWMRKRLDVLSAGMSDKEGDISVLDGIERLARGKKEDGWMCQPLCETLLRLHTADDYATEAGDLSLRSWGSDTDFPGQDALFPGGYEGLLRAFSKGVDVRLANVVEMVEWGGEGVVVGVEGGKHYRADSVVVTLPLGVLQAGKVRFEPVLPTWKQEAVGKLHSGHFNKVILRFPQVFWPPNDTLTFTGRLRDLTVMQSVVNFDKYFGVPVLVGLIGGSAAKRTEQMTDEDVVGMLMERLREAYGKDIPEPDAYLRTRWGQDPHAMGTFSSIPVGSNELHREILGKCVNGKLFWAGEATSVEYAGTVHGAYMSGTEVAASVKSTLLPRV